MPSLIRLIVGLGNPGKEYEDTRHNVGFMAADAIAHKYNADNWKKKFKGLTSGHGGEPPFFLLKPQTFMNLSGESVGEAMRFYQLATEDVIVIHDDLDLEPGQVKTKQGGGSGGHNGLKSIDQHIGQNYYRIRIGIGHPARGAEPLRQNKDEAVSNYVLSPFTKADQVWLDPLLEKLTADIPALLQRA